MRAKLAFLICIVACFLLSSCDTSSNVFQETTTTVDNAVLEELELKINSLKSKCLSDAYISAMEKLLSEGVPDSSICSSVLLENLHNTDENIAEEAPRYADLHFYGTPRFGYDWQANACFVAIELRDILDDNGTWSLWYFDENALLQGWTILYIDRSLSQIDAKVPLETTIVDGTIALVTTTRDATATYAEDTTLFISSREYIPDMRTIYEATFAEDTTTPGWTYSETTAVTIFDIDSMEDTTIIPSELEDILSEYSIAESIEGTSSVIDAVLQSYTMDTTVPANLYTEDITSTTIEFTDMNTD